MQMGSEEAAIREQKGKPDTWICYNEVLTREPFTQVSDETSPTPHRAPPRSCWHLPGHGRGNKGLPSPRLGLSVP